VFASNISNSGWGALTYRDDAKLYNSDKEKVILSPVSDIYVKLAEECITQRICVDLFYAINNPKSIDLTSIAPIATLTGGDLYFFNGYDSAKHGEKLHYDIFRVLYRNQVSEVAIKARTSTGLTVTEYFGGFGFKESADFELSAFDSDKSVGFLVRCDEKLKEDPTY
jgi:protein transport protein SEC24